MENRRSVLTVVGFIILAAAIIAYARFSESAENGKKEEQQTNDAGDELENIKTEDFGFEAQNYNSEMIIVAPQLDDWGQKSADQTIELTQYFLTHYKINPAKVYINGYSGGGETLSLVLAKQPELFTEALMCSSKWDGTYESVAKAKTPVYFVIGESDEYYGSEPFKEAYQTLYDLYQEQGLPDAEIDKLLVLDIKRKDYFEGTQITY